jgi:hypothetical protein
VTPIKTIRVHYKEEVIGYEGFQGLMMGIELIDFAGKTIAKAGDWSKSHSLIT